MKSLLIYLSGVISGVLLCVSYSEQYTWMIFIFLVPILYLSKLRLFAKRDITLATLILLLIWNVYNLSFLFEFRIKEIGLYIPLLILIYTIVGLLPFVFVLTKLRSKYWLILVVWVAIEFMYTQWFLKSPFHSLGIVIANYDRLTQWYSYTGVLGGTVWILAINIAISELLVRIKSKQKVSWDYIGSSMAIIVLPIVMSLVIYCPKECANQQRDVKFFAYKNNMTVTDVQKSILGTYEDDKEDEVDYRVLPELIVNINNELLDDNVFLNKIRLAKTNRKWFNETTLMAVNLYTWGKQQVLAVGLRNSHTQFRFKESLVPFGEYIPSLFRWAKDLDIIKENLPHTYISPRTGNNSFICNKDQIHVSICFESFFEEGLKEKIDSSVGAIFIVAKEPFGTNKHYKNLTRLLVKANAITFNKYIVRSSWGGLSTVVTDKGEIIKSSYSENNVLQSQILLNNKTTYFTNGRCNVIGIILGIMCFFIIGFEIRTIWHKKC